MLNFGAKTKSIMVFLKKAISEFRKPSLSKQGEVQNLSCVVCKRKENQLNLASFWNRGLGQLENGPGLLVLLTIVGHVTILKGILSFEISHLHGDETLPRTPPHFDLLTELGHAGITNIEWESKNEMNSGSFTKLKSSWKWSLVVFTLACALYFRKKQNKTKKQHQVIYNPFKLNM